jgi:two-component system sensor histidine kinase/response regulator
MSREFKELNEIFNLEAFMERIEADRTLAQELVELFLQEAPQMLAAVASAIADKDPQALSLAAHAIKGSIANFSAPRAVQAAATLERIGHENDLTNADLAFVCLQDQVLQLSEELKRAAAANFAN